MHMRCGPPQFGLLLKNTPLRILNLDVYVARQRRDLPHLQRLVETAEASHFWAFILLAPYVVYCAAEGRWEPFGWFLFAEIAANAYPAMHLRMVRARLERVQRRR